MSKITALLQRLLALLPFRRKPDANTDSAASADDEATPAPAASATTKEAAAAAVASTADGADGAEDAEGDMDAAVDRARKRLVWKKRIIIAVPALLLVIVIASVAVWLLGSSDEAADEHEASSTTQAHPEDGKTATPTDHPTLPLAAPAPVDPAVRAQELEAELKKMQQERNALLIEKNALAERNRKLQEAAARRAAKSTTQPRSRSPIPSSATNSGNGEGTAEGGSTDTHAPGPSVDCTISGDLEAAGELLKRCIEEFNAASEGQ